MQNSSHLSDQLDEQSSVLQEKDREIQITRGTTSQLQQELESEREKVEKLEGQLEATELVQDGLRQDLEKARTFCKKMGRTIGMEQETEDILAAGDFAHDAILMKAEQLVKHEV